LVFAAAASATDWQRYDAFLGYQFVRFNPNSPGFIPSFNANGGGGQFVYNFDKWFGAVFDAGAVNKGTLAGNNVDTTVASFTAGPRITWHNGGRWVPYGQVLFGGYYATTSTALSFLTATPPIGLPPALTPPAGLPVTARLNASNSGFAMLAGGGLDIKMGKHVYFRPFEADYYLLRLPSFLTTGETSNRNNFRYMAGVNFKFGGEK
jgi:hypothetical protein